MNGIYYDYTRKSVSYKSLYVVVRYDETEKICFVMLNYHLHNVQ